MFERIKWPGVALLLSLLAVLLRRWQMRTAFEETLGLHISGSPASMAMVACYILVAALFVLMVFRIPFRGHSSGWVSRWDLIFAAEKDIFYLVVMVVSAVLVLVAVPFLFRDAFQLAAARKAQGGGETGLFQIILAICGVPTCVAIVYSARNAYRMTGRSRENAGLLLPVVLDCLWLLETYRANSANPVAWQYWPLLLAIVIGLLFYLSCAGISFDLGHARWMLWLAALTVVTSAAAMASAPGVSMMFLYGSQLFGGLAALWVAPGNLRHPPSIDHFGLRAQTRQEKPADSQGEVRESEIESGDQEADIHE